MHVSRLETIFQNSFGTWTRREIDSQDKRKKPELTKTRVWYMAGDIKNRCFVLSFFQIGVL